MNILPSMLIILLSLEVTVSHPDLERLDLFLDKLEIFYEHQQQRQDTWAMPDFSLDSYYSKMPVISTYSVHPFTGLLYSEYKGEIIDGDLDLTFNVRSGKIMDRKLDKEYEFTDLIKARKKRKLT